MSSRDSILSSVRASAPKGDYPLPTVPTFRVVEASRLVDVFVRNLESMGGRHHEGDVASAIKSLFPDAVTVVSTTPEVTGQFIVTPDVDVNALARVDVAVVRASFGVAETGSVLLTDQHLICNPVAYLAQHLVVLLDPADIVESMHDAYSRPEVRSLHYASFHTGPSATADIEGVLIHGAQGVRTLTVVFA
jgi:L-lactate dehydrogenase complex protein LldG